MFSYLPQGGRSRREGRNWKGEAVCEEPAGAEVSELTAPGRRTAHLPLPAAVKSYLRAPEGVASLIHVLRAVLANLTKKNVTVTIHNTKAERGPIGERCQQRMGVEEERPDDVSCTALPLRRQVTVVSKGKKELFVVGAHTGALSRALRWRDGWLAGAHRQSRTEELGLCKFPPKPNGDSEVPAEKITYLSTLHVKMKRVLLR
ncbi:uncharacterized protein LJ206_014820 [Theristicus caerulescens]